MKETKTTIFIDQSRVFNPKSKSIDYYLELLGEYFDKLEVFNTAGDIRPPYPFQWRATSKVIEGDEDGYEGLGGTPYKAIKELYKNIKKFLPKNL